ncbi:MAG: hypothetical protein HYW90_02760 [Candidatus Sungbacteria bacterium]|nr:hypothetical protein [Candidatus Sungbacteria bacterium]
MTNKNSKVPDVKVHMPQAKQHNFAFCLLPFAFERERTGFTMVEIVIMLAIITLISSAVLVSFPSTLGSISTQISAQRFALALRQTQNQALAVRTVEGPEGPIIPRAVGIHADLTAPGVFFSFADLNVNHIYDASDIIIQEFGFDRGVRIVDIFDDGGRSQGAINIVFTTPSAETTLYNESDSIGQFVSVGVQAPGGELMRRVRIHITGQISIE